MLLTHDRVLGICLKLIQSMDACTRGPVSFASRNDPNLNLAQTGGPLLTVTVAQCTAMDSNDIRGLQECQNSFARIVWIDLKHDPNSDDPRSQPDDYC